jgi:hypothetical protein
MMLLADLIIIFHFGANLVTKKTFIIAVAIVAECSLFHAVTPGFKGKSECKNTCAPGSSYTHASNQ